MRRLVAIAAALALGGLAGCGVKAPPRPPVTQPGPRPAPKGVARPAAAKPAAAEPAAAKPGAACPKD